MVRNILIAVILLLNYGYGEVGRNPLAIEDGSPVNISKYQFMVSIHANRSLVCGGSIISRTLILTAAHCLDNVPIDTLLVSVDFSFSWIGPQNRKVSQVFIPDNYSPLTNERINDVCLLLLSVSLPYTFKPIELTNDTKLPNVGAKITILGFGDTETVFVERRLRKAKFNILKNALCEEQYGFFLLSQFCVGRKKLGHGDDGSPVLYRRKVIGVVSLFQRGFTVAVDIHNYLDFISGKMRNHT